MELADIAWGDVISDSEGVLVVEGTLRGDPVIVKRYAAPQHRREIANYALLGFRDEYAAQAAAGGVRIDPREAEVDEPLAHLATLVFAAEAEQTPSWAADSLAWLRAAPH